MSKPENSMPQGTRDLDANYLRKRSRILEITQNIYALHGFSKLETPAFEKAQEIGSHLPESILGVFAFQDNTQAEFCLRYDLTAPLGRYVKQNRNNLVLPFRRYQSGPVWRDEKPGPGRYREFWQCDADIIGGSPAHADAELAGMLSKVLQEIRVPEAKICISSRGLVDNLLDRAGVSADHNARLAVFRAIDKLDRLGIENVIALLGEGREDESGDYTPGAGLADFQIDMVQNFLKTKADTPERTLQEISGFLDGTGSQAIAELRNILHILENYYQSETEIQVDPSLVRGLAYYTGTVFEAVSADPKLGSIAGGGRYDSLIGEPATGISIGVDRLASSLTELETSQPDLVLVLSMGNPELHYLRARQLRDAGIPAEVYSGDVSIRKQMKYADKKGCNIAVLEGEQEKDAQEILLKDLQAGSGMKDLNQQEWKQHPAQVSIKEDNLVANVQSILERQRE